MIHELEKMIYSKTFDAKKAETLIEQIDVNQEYVTGEDEFKTTLLESASIQANLPMVELLLEHGADPNRLFNDDESTLWNLQYNYGETDEENEQRLLIAQRLLEYGADPLGDPDKMGEPLLNYVVYALFNDNDEEDFWNYRSRFLILLVAFGAKTEYCIPRIVGKFDKTNMKQYEFFMVPERNGKYGGVITDGQGNEVAYI